MVWFLGCYVLYKAYHESIVQHTIIHAEIDGWADACMKEEANHSTDKKRLYLKIVMSQERKDGVAAPNENPGMWCTADKYAESMTMAEMADPPYNPLVPAFLPLRHLAVW